MRYLVLALCSLCSLCIGACTDADADVAGDYATIVTNRDNGCNFDNWTANAETNASVTLTQGGNNVTATVTGLGALILEASIGGHVFTGRVAGDTLKLSLFGTRSNTTATCTYTFNSEINAQVDGDKITGQIDYSAATNGSVDCAALVNCRSFQDFAGTRPK
jgi:hypothetical protein